MNAKTRTALLILGLALLVRVAVIAADPGYVPQHDAFDYDRHAASIATGDGYPPSGYAPGGGETALRSPGYPALLGATYALTGFGADGGRLLGAFFGALLAVLCFLVVRRIWGHRTALVAGVLAALFPPLVLLSRELFSETMFGVLVLAVVLALLEHRAHGGRRLRWAAAAGALCGLAALTRNPGIALLLPAMIGAWVARPRLSATALAGPLVLLLSAALVIAPWTIRNAAEFGRFIPVATATGFGLAGTYSETARTDPRHGTSWRTPTIVPEYAPLFGAPGVDEGTLDATLRREALEYAGSHPGYVAEVSARNLLRMFQVEGAAVVANGEVVDERGIGSGAGTVEQVSLAIVLPLALIGILVLVRRPGNGEGDGRRLPRGPLFLWLIPVALILVAAPVAGLPRYRVPADPFLLMLAAIALVRGWVVLRGRWRRRAAAASVAAAGLLLLAGCGGGDEPAPDGTSTPSSGPGQTSAAPAVASNSLDDYISRADRLCSASLVATERISERALRGGIGTDVLSFTTEQLIAPGLKERRRLASEILELELPEQRPAALDTYLGLFQPIEELIVRRLKAGRRGDIEAAGELEILLGDLAAEQREAAIEAGFDDCSVDLLQEALG